MEESSADDDGRVWTSADLEQFRGYLQVLAQLHMNPRMAEKIEPADMVQQTFLTATRHLQSGQFRTKREVLSWLRLMLTHAILDAGRQFSSGKRDVAREQSLEAAMNASSQRLGSWLAAEQSTPSARVQRLENELRLADALMQLPDKQRQVLMLRHCQGLTFAEIGKRLGCSGAAVVGFLKRGGLRLRELLSDLE